MSDSLELLADISAYCRTRGMAHTTFGLRAINNSKLHERLKAGGSVTLETAKKIRAFMADGPQAGMVRTPRGSRKVRT